MRMSSTWAGTLHTAVRQKQCSCKSNSLNQRHYYFKMCLCTPFWVTGDCVLLNYWQAPKTVQESSENLLTTAKKRLEFHINIAVWKCEKKNSIGRNRKELWDILKPSSAQMCANRWHDYFIFFTKKLTNHKQEHEMCCIRHSSGVSDNLVNDLKSVLCQCVANS